MDEIRDYARSCGLKPSTVVQRAGAGGGGTWRIWVGGGSCTLRTVQRLRDWMEAHPPDSETGSKMKGAA